MTSYNYQAAAIILCEYFNTGSINKLDEIIKKQNTIFKNVLCNFLLLQAVKSQNSSLIEFITKNRFELKKAIFTEISGSKDHQSLIFLAKELFHNLHANKFPYNPGHANIILTKVLIIQQNNKDDKILSKSIRLLIDEMRQSPNLTTKSSFFGSLHKENSTRKLLDEIDKKSISKDSPRSP